MPSPGARRPDDASDAPRDARGAGADARLVRPEAVEEAMGHRSPDATLAELADIFSALSDPTRLRIVEALAFRELCVADLAAVVGNSPSAVSHHLRQLRQLKLVRYRREGRMSYYRLDDAHVEELLRTGLEHVRE